ncbi:MAG: hypothetical protein SA339_12595 [Methanomassiliicoccus sp.]|nr:hypothetical protein [Methanomassiliicoccus sp.]
MNGTTNFQNPMNRRNLAIWGVLFAITGAVAFIAIALVVPDMMIAGLIAVVLFMSLFFYLLAGQYEIGRPQSVVLGDVLVLQHRSRGAMEIQYDRIISIVPYPSLARSGDHSLNAQHGSFVITNEIAKAVREKCLARTGRDPGGRGDSRSAPTTPDRSNDRVV